MRIGRPAARYLSEIVADADLDMDGHKLTGLSAPADQNDSLRYGQAEIRNAEIALAAEIILSKLVDTYLLPTVMTTRGDLVYRASEYPVRIVAGDEGKVLTMGANDPHWAAAPSHFAVPDTIVFNGSADTPAAWTDLDLSAVVGSNPALVLLSVIRGVNACGDLQIRRNGDTTDLRGDFLAHGNIANADELYHFLVLTDGAGLIEWNFDSAVLLVVARVKAYIK